MPIQTIEPGTSPEAPGNWFFYKQGSARSTGVTISSEGVVTAPGGVNGSGPIALTGATAATDLISTDVTGDTQKRLVINADGSMEWGPGNAVADTSLQRASTSSLRITPTGNASASTSVGGALNITGNASTGAGLVVYSEQAAPAGHLLVARVNSATWSQSGIFSQYNGTGHNVNISHAGTGAASSALNIGSTNPANSAVGIGGVETGKGTVKITHTGTGTDANASAISIDLAGSGTACQGIFVTATGGGTTGQLLVLRNGGTGSLAEFTATGVLGFGSGTGATDATIARTAAATLSTNSDVRLSTIGKGLQVAEGSNAKMGLTAAMTAGTITVNTTAVTANSRIFLTAQNTGGAPGALRVSARVAATSFTITSTSGTDTSTVAWFIVEPA